MSKILVVDDESIIAMSLQQKLISWGYDVPVTANSGVEAVELAGDQAFDLILMDIRLGEGIDGIEAADIIRKKYGTHVIFLSAFSDESTLQRAKLTEPYGYTIKPVVDRELRIVVEIALYRNNIERELKRNNEMLSRFQFIVNSITDHLTMVDREFCYMAVNDSFCGAMRKPRAELIGKSIAEIMGSEFFDTLKMPFKSCFDGNVESLRLWMQLGIFGKRFCTVSLYPYRMLPGPYTHAILVTHDITSENEAENELIRARNTAVDASKTKSAFLANMSHEIRTPIHGILGLSHLAKQTQQTMQQSNYTSKIEFLAQNLLRIVNDILDISKIEAGKVELDHIEFSLEEVLSDLLPVLTIQAQQKKLDIKLNVAVGLPSTLLGDPMRLTQVLLNLASNAIKFTPSGSVELSVAIVRQSLASVCLRFCVNDTGIGMAPSDIERLFKPFSQADASSTRVFGGSGLGLAISYSYVEMMGGRICVESIPEKGSSFHFDLEFSIRSHRVSSPRRPFALPPAPSAISSTDQQLITASIETHAPGLVDRKLEGARILLVEDNEINQLIAEELLCLAGCRVMVAANGLEALRVLRDAQTEESFDAVLMDIHMPAMDGYSATRRLRDDPRFATLPVIAMTADAIVGVKEECLSAGMNDYLTKPIDVAQMYKTLAYWVSQKALPPETARL